MDVDLESLAKMSKFSRELAFRGVPSNGMLVWAYSVLDMPAHFRICKERFWIAQVEYESGYTMERDVAMMDPSRGDWKLVPDNIIVDVDSNDDDYPGLDPVWDPLGLDKTFNDFAHHAFQTISQIERLDDTGPNNECYYTCQHSYIVWRVLPLD
jgi:hypothetical protein